MNTSVSEIANLVGGTVLGDPAVTILGISPIDNIQPGHLVYAEGLDNFKKVEQSAASAILAASSLQSETKPVIQVTHPLKAFITLLEHFHPKIKPVPGIHPSAVIEEGVTLGEGITIGPFVHIESGAVIGDYTHLKSNVYIGHQAHIGSHCVLHPNVTIYNQCTIGSRVHIHAATVIGSDGFGYKFIDGEHIKIPHVGNVIIEDDVEIGSGTTIDRATLGSTIIGKGTKIDNLVQIAHSVKLGEHNIVCAFTGIAGSTVSGNNVIFAAKVGVADHVRIDDGVILLAGADVAPNKHLRAGNMYLGTPARPRQKALELELSATRIPIMSKHLKNLSEKVAELSKKIDGKE